MYVAEIPNRRSPPSFLLRESYREDGKVKNRTLANLTSLPASQIQAIRQTLQGRPMVDAEADLRVTRSLPHGHVRAVLRVIQQLGLEQLLGSRKERKRDLVVAMIVQRILEPSSKLAATRLWKNTTLGDELNVRDAQVNELYQALDWLGDRQRRIENKLAKRHLENGGHVLYDVSSSSYFGRECSLAQFGHNRDGRRDLPCIVYGMMTDAEGRPIALDVYPGNTADPSTVPDQVDKVRNRFQLKRVVMVGDRGMLTQTQIDTLRMRPGIGWISALRSSSIRRLVEAGDVERSLFDEQNLAEIRSPEFPGERLMACFNPLLADRRRNKREALLKATEKELVKIVRCVARRTKKPLTASEIGVKVGRVKNRFKVGKHYMFTIADNEFSWARDEAAIAREAALDGVYVIRTSEKKTTLSSDDVVRSYKQLRDVEQAFRTMKGFELSVRPIHHRENPRVRSHFFLCLLAYYVQWHLKRAWAPLLFVDEDLPEHKARRDPVAQAEPSDSAQEKKQRGCRDSSSVDSLRTLLRELATQCRTTCEIAEASFERITEPTEKQTTAFRLLETACSQH